MKPIKDNIVLGKSGGKYCKVCDRTIAKDIKRYENTIGSGRYGSNIAMVICPECALNLAQEFNETDVLKMKLTTQLKLLQTAYLMTKSQLNKAQSDNIKLKMKMFKEKISELRTLEGI